MPLLRIISPEVPERTVDIDRHNTLGRHPDNSIQILDRIVSKNHCHIDGADGQYVLKDLGSLNGTFVNGVRVEGTCALRAGDEITLGSTRLTFDPLVLPVAEPVQEAGKQAGKVTMTASAVESHVRAKLAQQAELNFVPERLVMDAAAVRRDYEKLRVSFELTRAIAGELDVDRLLAKILTAALQLLSADRGVVLLLDKYEKLQPRCIRTKHGEGGEEVVLSQTIINEVLRDRSAVLSSDASIDSRFKGAQSIIMQGIRSSMAVPLVYSEELLGVMVLDSQVATNAFTEKDLQLTQALANQAAVAIQNSLYAQKLEQEALTRQRFQRLLSPAIAELVVSGEVEVGRAARARETTVFFSDIRGFTAMSEKRAAQDIVDMLNEYFELMVEMIFKYEGTLDKFVGDEIMALFGAPVSHRDDAYPRGQGRGRADARARGVEPGARAEGEDRDPDRHRHQHRRGGRGLPRQQQSARVHRDRRCREHGVAAVLARPGRRNHHQQEHLRAGQGLLQRRGAAAGTTQRQVASAADLPRAGRAAAAHGGLSASRPCLS